MTEPLRRILTAIRSFIVLLSARLKQPVVRNLHHQGGKR
jgi:hypothetical protein